MNSGFGTFWAGTELALNGFSDFMLGDHTEEVEEADVRNLAEWVIEDTVRMNSGTHEDRLMMVLEDLNHRSEMDRNIFEREIRRLSDHSVEEILRSELGGADLENALRVWTGEEPGEEDRVCGFRHLLAGWSRGFDFSYDNLGRMAVMGGLLLLASFYPPLGIGSLVVLGIVFPLVSFWQNIFGLSWGLITGSETVEERHSRYEEIGLAQATAIQTLLLIGAGIAVKAVIPKLFGGRTPPSGRSSVTPETPAPTVPETVVPESAAPISEAVALPRQPANDITSPFSRPFSVAEEIPIQPEASVDAGGFGGGGGGLRSRVPTDNILSPTLRASSGNGQPPSRPAGVPDVPPPSESPVPGLEQPPIRPQRGRPPCGRRHSTPVARLEEALTPPPRPLRDTVPERLQPVDTVRGRDTPTIPNSEARPSEQPTMPGANSPVGRAVVPHDTPSAGEEVAQPGSAIQNGDLPSIPLPTPRGVPAANPIAWQGWIIHAEQGSAAGTFRVRIVSPSGIRFEGTTGASSASSRSMRFRTNVGSLHIEASEQFSVSAEQISVFEEAPFVVNSEFYPGRGWYHVITPAEDVPRSGIEIITLEPSNGPNGRTSAPGRANGNGNGLH